MRDGQLADHLAIERSDAIRILLGSPLLNNDDADAFRSVIRNQTWLAEWFEMSCGWRLVADVSAGFARLAKRPAVAVDITRPLRRPRSRADAPFDRRRYQLLCLVCAELVRHPVTTVGLLARAVTAEAGLDSSRRRERSAFVDALLVLVGWHVLGNAAGDVEAYVDDSQSNAILTADTTRLHQLIVSVQPPSAVGAESSDAVGALLAEPRYATDADDLASADEEQRLRWVRHSLMRRLLDDPVVHLDDLTGAERDYLANPSGRRWIRDRVATAGFVLEERSDGLLAVDPTAVATDATFPSPLGTAHQFALLLIDRVVQRGPDSSRHLMTLTAADLQHEVRATLRRFPGWANSHREGDGPQRLIDQAAGLLVAFGLCRRPPDGSLVPCSSLARYRVGEPTVSSGQSSLFEETS